MVIAGEASGDLHAGNVIRRLKELRPEIELFGTGGELLAQAGTRLLYRVEDLAVIGFWEVLKRYSYYKGIFNKMVNLLDAERPDAVFLVDYAGFNLRFAKEAKKRGIKVIFYVAPQVWAWKKDRVKTMRACIDELIVLFPFEVEFFKQHGITCRCFGHPLLDICKPSRSRAEALTAVGLDPAKMTLALLPGSRYNEIHKHLPLLVPTLERLHQMSPDLQFVYPLAPTIQPGEVESAFAGKNLPLALAQGMTYDLVAAADLALVASGTATLETALLGTPLVIFYKVTKATHWIGRNLLKIGAVGLPNIVAGREIVPELIQHDFNPQTLANLAADLLIDPQKRSLIKSDLAALKLRLGEQGAYQKTADFLAAQLKKEA